MPRVFKIGPYLVYFWSDEQEPLEPVHVHISPGVPTGPIRLLLRSWKSAAVPATTGSTCRSSRWRLS